MPVFKTPNCICPTPDTHTLSCLQPLPLDLSEDSREFLDSGMYLWNYDECQHYQTAD